MTTLTLSNAPRPAAGAPDRMNLSGPRNRVALVTATPSEDLYVDKDLPLLQRALNVTGTRADIVRWDDASVDWRRYDAAMVRSTWDYVTRFDEFQAWIDRCSSQTRLLNPPSVLRWNADKHYLADLSGAGVPTVTTQFLPPGSAPEHLLPREHEYVIKPTTGNAARMAARYRQEDREVAVDHARKLHRMGLTAMVQPYMQGIDTTGEHALVFVAGRYSHAAAKNAMLTAGVAHDAWKTTHPGLRPYTPTERELAVARQALAAVPGAPELLYARVDLVEDDRRNPCVLELELLEPDLFLSLQPGTGPERAAFTVAQGLRSAIRQRRAALAVH